MSFAQPDPRVRVNVVAAKPAGMVLQALTEACCWTSVDVDAYSPG
jgi:hypothetical protein